MNQIEHPAGTQIFTRLVTDRRIFKFDELPTLHTCYVSVKYVQPMSSSSNGSTHSRVLSHKTLDFSDAQVPK